MGEAKRREKLDGMGFAERSRIEAMMKMALLLAVKDHGGSYVLPVHRIDTEPVGLTLDMEVLPGGSAFKFTVRER